MIHRSHQQLCTHDSDCTRLYIWTFTSWILGFFQHCKVAIAMSKTINANRVHALWYNLSRGTFTSRLLLIAPIFVLILDTMSRSIFNVEVLPSFNLHFCLCVSARVLQNAEVRMRPSSLASEPLDFSNYLLKRWISRPNYHKLLQS